MEHLLQSSTLMTDYNAQRVRIEAARAIGRHKLKRRLTRIGGNDALLLCIEDPNTLVARWFYRFVTR
jgi:hypothetical protein